MTEPLQTNDLPCGASPSELEFGVWNRNPAPLNAIAVIVGGGMAMDLAVRSSLASLVGLIAVFCCVGMVVLLARSPGPRLYLLLGLVVLLSTNLVLRTSAWVIAPTAIAIGALLLLAAQEHVVSSKPFTLLLVYFRWIDNTFTSLGWLAETASNRSRTDDFQLRAIIRGTATALAIATLLALLLAAADSVFASLLGGIGGSNFWGHLVLIAAFTLAFAGLGAAASSDKPLPVVGYSGPRFGVEGLMGLAAMNSVLGVWCGTQLFVVLGHADETLMAKGLSRAEYARRGFFELVVVVIVVVGLLNILDRVTERNSPQSNRWFVSLGIGATLETLVLVAVTYGRLDFYMDEFGLTMLRLSVACFLGWLAVVLVFVALRLVGVGANRNWTAAASLILAATTTVGFGWTNPEALVTKFNVARTGSVEVDVQYLANLSADAQPELIQSLGALSPHAAKEVAAYLCENPLQPTKYGLLGLNLNHRQAERARASLACN